MINLVAELGTLHLDTHASQLDATKAAFDAGATHVKTQLINPETAWWATQTQYERYKYLYKQWTISDWYSYFEQANKIGPTFASVFSEAFLKPYLLDSMPYIKLGHKLNSMPRLRSQIFSMGKPVIISCKTEIEVDANMSEYGAFNNKHKPIVLYVQPLYPTMCWGIRFPMFRSASSFFNGLSFHGLGDKSVSKADIVIHAIQLGAAWVEVHCMDERTQNGGLDAQFAFTLPELRELRKRIDDI